MWIVFFLFLFLIMVMICYEKDQETFRERTDPLIEKVRNNVVTMVEYMQEKYPTERETQALKTFDPNTIQERHEDDKHSAYYRKRNNEESVGLCLTVRENADPKKVDENTLMFVVLHELNHKIYKGHDHDFQEGFRFLMSCASEAGVYVPVNYNKHPVMYCSNWVNKNPYFTK